jgi:ribosomal-protein-alanine N-acetyltransferase
MISLLPRRRVFVDELRTREAEALVDIHGEAFRRAWTADEFAALLGERSVFGLALRQESFLKPRRIAGFVLARVAADESEILTIALRPESRGRGYGRMLMEEALRRLYRQHVATCFLEVDRDNEAAVGLYRSLEFQKIGERKRYYRGPKGADGTALVMRAQLR